MQKTGAKSSPARSRSLSPFKPSPALALQKLADENKALRMQLRSLNEQLDTVILSLTSRKKPPQDTSQEELSVAQKQVPIYEYDLLRSQHAKLSARVSQLLDTSYQVSLEQSVLQQQARVRELEAQIAMKKKWRKQRENVLESVLDTGQTPEMAAKLGDLQAEIVIANRKVAEVQRRNGQIEEVMGKLKAREEELIGKLAELEAKGVSLVEEPVPSLPPVSASPGLKLLENSLIKKRVRIHALEKEVKELTTAFNSCSGHLSRLSVDLESKSAELLEITSVLGLRHRRGRSNTAGRVFIT